MKLKLLFFICLAINQIIVQSSNKCDEISCNCDANDKCSSCRQNFKAFDQFSCVFDENTIQYEGGSVQIPPGITPIRYCNYQASYAQQCYSCVNSYQYDGSKCVYYCSKVNKYIEYHLDCKQPCKIANPKCTSCDSKDDLKCISCDSTTYLYQGNCIPSCPDGTFSDLNRECKICSPQCKTCASADECTTCNISDITNPPECLCPNNLVFAKNQCLSSCPLYYDQIKQGVCKRQCPQKQYPLVNQNNSQISCVSITSYSDEFCLQHLQKVKNLVSFKLVKITSDQYQFLIRVEETPYECYHFGIQPKYQFGYFTQNFQIYLDYYEYTFQFSKSEFLSPYYSECEATYCEIIFNLYWENTIQYIFKSKVNLDIAGTLTNDIIFTGNPEEIVVGIDDPIPIDKIIDSKIEVNCQTGQICNQNQITAAINSDVSVTQKINDPLLTSKTLLPHSLKYGQINIPYKYVNNIPGQITFTFTAFALQSGRIVVTSYFKGSKSRRLLTGSPSQNSVTYQQQTFEFKVISTNVNAANEEQSSESESNNNIIIIIMAVCLSVLVIGIGSYCLYRKIKAKKQPQAIPQPEVIPQNDNNNQIIDQSIAKQNYSLNGNVNNQQNQPPSDDKPDITLIVI